MSYQICTKCVMDSSLSPEIKFNQIGVCNFCETYENYEKNYLSKIDKPKEFENLISKIKTAGKGQKYDCILGLSGGVDSSFLALKLYELGIRPLLVQFDNGWNTELAAANIQNIAEKCSFDLITYVVNWAEFKDVQTSFIKASVRNLEAPSDHAIFATIYNTALKHKIKYVISGVNYQTEFTSCKSFGHSYKDLIFIKALHKKFGKLKLKTFPMMSYLKRIYFDFVLSKVEYLPLLNFMEYDKEKAIKELVDKIGWKPYEGKHFESTITIFHQSYYLIKKFGLDKRRLHLSDLIRTGLITRNKALEELKSEPLDQVKLNEIVNYVAKKLEMSVEELNGYINLPEVKYNDYPNYDKQVSLFNTVVSIYGKLKKNKK